MNVLQETLPSIDCGFIRETHVGQAFINRCRELEKLDVRCLAVDVSFKHLGEYTITGYVMDGSGRSQESEGHPQLKESPDIEEKVVAPAASVCSSKPSCSRQPSLFPD